MVSVCMITYNHEKYISKAIEGVLMQKTTFPIELIIGEDCSTDSTRKIVVEYAEKYPDLIRPLLPESNLGMMKNFIKTMEAAKGKYIALCEGDDYWTDLLKLQKQVDFLEGNEEYIMCYTAFSTVDSNGHFINWNNTNAHRNRSFSGDILPELLKGNYILTLTVLFRKIVLNQFVNLLDIDYSLFLLLALNGKCKYFKEETGHYRLHASSAIHNLSDSIINKSIEVFFMIIEMYFSNKKYRRTPLIHFQVLTNISFRLISLYSIPEYKLKIKSVF